MNQYILFLIILGIPISALVIGFFSVLKLLYGKATYENLDNDIQSHIEFLLTKINKQSYVLKKLDDNLKQDPIIIVTRNGILINEHKIKNLSDNALESGLLYEIGLYKKKIYIYQIFFGIAFSVFLAWLLVQVFPYFGSILGLLGHIIFYPAAVIIEIYLLFFVLESINFAQKAYVITHIIKNSNVDNHYMRGLKEYFGYYKSYFNHASNMKYDIDKQLDLLNHGFKN